MNEQQLQLCPICENWFENAKGIACLDCWKKSGKWIKVDDEWLISYPKFNNTKKKGDVVIVVSKNKLDRKVLGECVKVQRWDKLWIPN